MAQNTLDFEVVTPERLVLSQAVELVVIPGLDGDIGVLPGHAPLMTALRMGTITIFADGRPERSFFVAGGFAEITAAGCAILAEAAYNMADLNEANVKQEISDYKDELDGARDDLERQKISAALVAAQAKHQALTNPTYR